MEKEILKTRRANIAHKTECVWDTTYQILVANRAEDRLRSYIHKRGRKVIETFAPGAPLIILKVTKPRQYQRSLS